MGGPYFEFLVVEPELIYVRRGIRRKVGIQPQWHHHPDAIRISESVFERFSDAFRASHSGFNYYGPTEYDTESTTRLCDQLSIRAGQASIPKDSSRADVAKVDEAIRKILALAEYAISTRRVLLVLGI